MSQSNSLLQGKEREETLRELSSSGWTLVDNRDAIKKSYRFGNFVEAFSFMQEIAFHAEHLNHHPEWFNVYNRVDVTLATHDANGLTMLDYKLAKIMDSTNLKHVK